MGHNSSLQTGGPTCRVRASAREVMRVLASLTLPKSISTA